MNENPYGLKTVLDWDDGRRSGDNIMVTTIYGLAFEAGDEHGDGSHCQSFETVGAAKRALAKKRLQKCHCPRCAEGLLRADIARLMEGEDNTPQADGFRSFPEWMEVADMADRVK